ncbi:MAG: GLPGLI family protein [Flavobacteriaceae bacterium]|nr:GLPGLI family protein [Flavobacteriaceae bacterium]
MKKLIKLLFLLPIISSLSLFGQNYRFVYSVNFKKTLSSDRYWQDNVVTDISENTIKSYSYEFIVYDSLNKTNPQNGIFYANPKFEERFIKNLKTGKTTNYENFLVDFFSYESNDKMDWQLMNDTKTIADYKVQKAKTTFGNREWIAWFASDIPFQYGPYKFCGLPGMILEIADTNEDYIFSLSQIKKLPGEYDTTSFLETYYDDKPLPIKLEQIKKLKINYFLDPYKEFKSGQKKGFFQDDEGNTIEKPNFNKMTTELQKSIKDNNNPIELDKAVNYPEK